MLRPRLEAAVAAISAGLALLTLFWPDWIERLTGLEPDEGSGMLEWAIVIGLAVGAVGVGLLARRDFRLARLRLAGESLSAGGEGLGR